MTEFAHEYAKLGPETLRARTQLRKDIQSGKTDWRTIILEPPACLGDMLLTEVLSLFVPGIRRANIEILGRRAFHAGLTLTTRAQRSSVTTRQWLVAAVPMVQSGPSGKRARPHNSARRGAMP